MNIKQFQADVRELSQKLDTQSPERRIMYLVTEVGEVVDEVLNLLNADENIPSEQENEIKECIGLEIYDLIWNAVDLANMLDIDLEVAFAKKTEINKHRIWKRSSTLDTDT